MCGLVLDFDNTRRPKGQKEIQMDSFLMADVERQVYKDWEQRFNKRVIRRSSSTGIDVPQIIRSLIDNLKRTP